MSLKKCELLRIGHPHVLAAAGALIASGVAKLTAFLCEIVRTMRTGMRQERIHQLAV
jgi:hypothetical protein